MPWVSREAADSVEWGFCMQSNMPQAKTVLVTGAAKRLGKAIALDLVGHGWQVALHYHHSKQEALATQAELAAFGSVEIFQADLSEPQACQQLFAQVLSHFGQVNALVNSASQFEHDDARNFQPRLAQSHLAVNCVAPIVLAQALYAHLSARANGAAQATSPPVQGAVVNLLDQKLWNLNPDFLSYTLSKAALQAATTMMAQSFAPLLRVCGVAPGLTLPSYLQDAAAFQQAHQVSPLGRSSRPEDVARTVRFVLENESMTASQILVDGGQHLMHLPRDISFL
jgi:NAD(P)-dependent dehydrogenase (short-subunit alcohol dehydrogenase family)